ncbi:MAG TPA: hypothetical protein VFV38_08365 [Ktedonobacteraceae bacterium]|nr:hypothetical protein [Ktedonobacteraceae bacterium]
MPNSDGRKVQPVENLTSALRRSQKRFGELLRELCEVAGVTQGKLSRDARAERQRLIEEGYIRPEEPIGSMEQPTISKVMAGVQAPSYYQVYIWLRVLRRHYESERLAEICKELSIPVPIFSRETERKLWQLATFVPPEELNAIFEESKGEKPMEASPTLIDHKELRWASSVSRSTVSPDTEVNLNAVSEIDMRRGMSKQTVEQ